MTDEHPTNDPDRPQTGTPWDQMASPALADWPLGRLLSTAARRVEREWNAHLAAWELNHASLPVLVQLMRRPHSQRELADACGVTEQTMSRVLARMERTGYVTRAPHRGDKRQHVIAVTDAGRAVAVHAADPAAPEEMTTRGLTPEQVEQLRGLLAIVATASPAEHRGPGPAASPTPRDGSAGS